MMNIRLANAPLFFTQDISEIVEGLDARVSSIMSDTGSGALSANQLATAFFEMMEGHLHDAVDDMRDLRE